MKSIYASKNNNKDITFTCRDSNLSGKLDNLIEEVNDKTVPSASEQTKNEDKNVVKTETSTINTA